MQGTHAGKDAALPPTRGHRTATQPPRWLVATTWIRRYVEGRKTGEREGYAVVDDAGTFLGAGLLPFVDAGTRTAERLVLHLTVDNPASQRVAEQCGYRLEGVLRSEHQEQGRRADTQVWSLLPGDPRPSRD